MQIEINDNYQEKLDILKEVFVKEDWTKLDNNQLVEALADTFLEFVQSQAAAEHAHSHEEGSCCGGGHCN